MKIEDERERRKDRHEKGHERLAETERRERQKVGKRILCSSNTTDPVSGRD